MDKALADALKPLKPMNIEQLGKCQDAALKDVEIRIGPQPERESFNQKMSWRAVVQPLDILGVLLFFVLLTISLIHMLQFTGNVADGTFEEMKTTFQGIAFSVPVWIVAHQLTFFAFSELGVLFFFIRHSMNWITWRDQHKGEKIPFGKRWLSASSVAAFACAIIAIVANVTSLTYSPNPQSLTLSLVLNGFIGFLIPMLTLLLGERAAEILLDYLVEKQRAIEAFGAALATWMAKTADKETYDEHDGIHSFRQFLAKRIVQYYKQYIVPNSNPRVELEWTPEIEVALAAREIARTKLMERLDEEVSFFIQPSSTAQSQEQKADSRQPQPEESHLESPLISPSTPSPSLQTASVNGSQMG